MTVRQKSARRKSPHSRRKSRRNMRKSTSTRDKTARKSKSVRHGYHRMLRGGTALPSQSSSQHQPAVPTGAAAQMIKLQKEQNNLIQENKTLQGHVTQLKREALFLKQKKLFEPDDIITTITTRNKSLEDEVNKLKQAQPEIALQNQNAVTKLASILESITNDDDKTQKIDEQFNAITQFFGNTLNERKQGKIKTILRSSDSNMTKATSILQAIADDKKSRDSMYALLGLGGAAAAYMLGRKHGGKTEMRRQSSSKNRQG
jgi:hypothetical protein